ncbi:MAG: dTDP-4-dehydrorhamnose 3,5-epimerase [Elainellaceae cyanobacterium]
MNVIETSIPDVLILEPRVFQDSRGYFYESYNEKLFSEKAGIDAHFVQDNHSCSTQNVLRGLHYQIQNIQGKLIRVVAGAVFDVAVDLRKSSPTFKQWIGCMLDTDNRRQLWIPPGFAHGFLTLSPVAEVLYKTTDYYAPQHERCIAWNEPSLAIDWHCTEPPILSDKDRSGCYLDQADLFP